MSETIFYAATAIVIILAAWILIRNSITSVVLDEVFDGMRIASALPEGDTKYESIISALDLVPSAQLKMIFFVWKTPKAHLPKELAQYL